jgi:uncharacterized protein (TIGR00369 family)
VTELARPHLLSLLDLTDIPAGADVTVDLIMELRLEPHLLNPRGGLQGGLVATLVDIAAGRALLLGLPEDQSVATADLSLHFLSAVTIGPARAEATVLRRGRSTSVVRVEVRDMGRDVLAAVSTVSFAVVTLRPGQVDPGREPTSG